MFKPHVGKCKQCPRTGLIVVKRGLCKRCNEQSKAKNKTRPGGNRGTAIPEKGLGNANIRIQRRAKEGFYPESGNDTKGSGSGGGGKRKGSFRNTKRLRRISKGNDKLQAYKTANVGGNERRNKYSSIPKKRKEPTGEAPLFKRLFDEALQASWPECPTCRVCGDPMGFEPKVSFFSHLLGKKAYPSFILLPENIWICCVQCHDQWHTKGEHLPKFAAKRAERDRLKELYYKQNKIKKL